jgi:hypothetical protein
LSRIAVAFFSKRVEIKRYSRQGMRRGRAECAAFYLPQAYFQQGFATNSATPRRARTAAWHIGC